jgi:hypothetical protein
MRLVLYSMILDERHLVSPVVSPWMVRAAARAGRSGVQGSGGRCADPAPHRIELRTRRSLLSINHSRAMFCWIGAVSVSSRRLTSADQW